MEEYFLKLYKPYIDYLRTTLLQYQNQIVIAKPLKKQLWQEIIKNKIVFNNMTGNGYGCNPKYIAEENNIKQNNNKFHDRYIIIDYNTDDYKIFHCGASSKDSGKSINTIIEIKEKELHIPLVEKVLR